MFTCSNGELGSGGDVGGEGGAEADIDAGKAVVWLAVRSASACLASYCLRTAVISASA